MVNMNMQQILKQAQKLQKDMQKSQEEISKMSFNGKASGVSITLDGKGFVTDIKISLEQIADDDIEMLQDSVMLAFNDAKKQLDKITEAKMGSLTKGMPGLF